jgi:hypothetical protein
MRGSDIQTAGLVSYVSCEARVQTSHPLRAIRAIVDKAPNVLSPDFEAMYSAISRPIPPEKLLRACCCRPGCWYRRRCRSGSHNHQLTLRPWRNAS